VNGEVDDDDVD